VSGPAGAALGHTAGAGGLGDRRPGDAEAVGPQRRTHDAAGKAPAVELRIADELLAGAEGLGRLEDPQRAVGEAHVAHRPGDAPVLDEERAIA
jgi:hypothetical protein